MTAEGQPLAGPDDVWAALRAGQLDGLTGHQIREMADKLDRVISVCAECRCLIEYPAGTRIVASGKCPLCSQAQEP